VTRPTHTWLFDRCTTQIVPNEARGRARLGQQPGGYPTLGILTMSAQAITSTIDGQEYAIDLSERSVQRFNDALEPVISASRAVTSSARAAHTYPALTPTAAVTNPERGFYHHAETHSMLPSSLGFSEYSSLSEQQLESWRLTEGATVALCLWHLERYVSGNELDHDMLRATTASRYGPEPS
jgi:hypothetical protein